MADRTQKSVARVKEIEDIINNMPRAILGGLFANEVRVNIAKEPTA